MERVIDRSRRGSVSLRESDWMTLRRLAQEEGSTLSTVLRRALRIGLKTLEGKEAERN